MRLSKTPRSRLRRTALSPRMVGLVTFSFSLLALGVIAYAASLPSLIQVSSRSDEQSLAYILAKGMFDEEALSGKGSDSKEGPAAEDDGDSKDAEGEQSDSPKKTVTLGGVTLQGVIGEVVNGSGPNAGGGSSSGSGGATGDAGGGATDGPAPEGPSTPTEPPVTEEQEQQYYDALLAKVNLVNGYVGEINGATSAFNNDCTADRLTREARLVEAKGLRDRLLNEYLYLRDGILVANESHYKSDQGDLIRMYRLLTEYMSVVTDAWEYNVGEAPGDVNALLGNIRNAQNNQLAEFQQVYNGFAL